MGHNKKAFCHAESQLGRSCVFCSRARGTSLGPQAKPNFPRSAFCGEAQGTRTCQFRDVIFEIVCSIAMNLLLAIERV